MTTEVPIKDDRGVYTTDAIMGDNSHLTVIIDSGATISTVDPKTAYELVSTGHAIVGPIARFNGADGLAIPERLIMIDKVKVGDAEATNIKASVNSSVTLIGLNALKALGHGVFTIDMNKNVLKLGSE